VSVLRAGLVAVVVARATGGTLFERAKIAVPTASATQKNGGGWRSRSVNATTTSEYRVAGLTRKARVTETHLGQPIADARRAAVVSS
jgi:hypothetical protein